MRITIKELLDDCIKFEYTDMAHIIYCLVREGKANLDDSIDSVNFNTVDYKKANELIDKNYLGFKLIKIFALKVEDQLFAFVLAKSKEDAIEFTKRRLRKEPRNCFEYPLDFDMQRGKQILTFRDMKNEHESFPAFVGYYEKDNVYR